MNVTVHLHRILGIVIEKHINNKRNNFRYVSAQEKTQEAEGKVTGVQQDIQNKMDQIKSNEREAKDLDKQVAELNKKLDEVRLVKYHKEIV